MSSEPIPVIVYTLARKFPKLIGKFPNGQPIPFGPFTRIQCAVLVAAAAVILLVYEIAHPPILGTLFFGAAITIPTVIMARRIGFAMARPTSRLLWFIRPRLRRAPLSTGGRPPQRHPRPTATGTTDHALDLEFLS
ncbi:MULTISPECIES: hypothetical protein [Mycobacteroides]|uniref:hypothetical protein n=1 Tax=Mycobacteroides TaxID=670516 RepID=UPI00071441E0|nr:MULTISPECIES: hypothetical protein [Mycobacteroides]KRQ20595.1 hypothetical protein AOT87_17815 [Mycobacteroides sp. H003]KRQ20989.1 hypothetical protein AOT91_26575 [Mycobacteroides sp. H092]KRQ35407.1 hypothetical protein AOT92_24235 [Mycobacteroides sp. H101]KRQ45681.1 hypothetical protein AOT88_19725 [Mycobacteroides sp. H063]KRQ55466.1 hypothetical protein AOT90_28150 [Mycobacteroides sp. H079]